MSTAFQGQQGVSVETGGSPEINAAQFLELKITGYEAPWCVDGRPDNDSEKGPQILGGSLHPVVLAAVWFNEELDRNFLSSAFSTLRDNGYGIGVHCGSHRHGENSDCGFADNLPAVFQKVSDKRQTIMERLLDVYSENADALGIDDDETFANMLENAFDLLTNYDTENFQLTGETLIKTAEAEGAAVVNLEGDHQEQVAFVNMKPDVTFDTNQSNTNGCQAFNLDLPVAVEQAATLGVDDNFAIAASLILYQATEMVLVEDKGKRALQVALHS